jgi:hypothetical protein
MDEAKDPLVLDGLYEIYARGQFCSTDSRTSGPHLWLAWEIDRLLVLFLCTEYMPSVVCVRDEV